MASADGHKRVYKSDFDRPGGQLWDDAGFRARVEHYAARAEKTVPQICAEAGLAADYLHKHAAKSGRSIEAILRLAAVLGVNATDLIAQNPGKSGRTDRTRTVNPQVGCCPQNHATESE
jgi:hypothetical protein